MSVHNDQMLLLKSVTEVRGGNNFTLHIHLCKKIVFWLGAWVTFSIKQSTGCTHSGEQTRHCHLCREGWGPGVGDCALSAFLCSSFSLLRVILFYESNGGLSSEWNYGAFVFSSYFPKNHIKEESKNLMEY